MEIFKICVQNGRNIFLHRYIFGTISSAIKMPYFLYLKNLCSLNRLLMSTISFMRITSGNM